MNSRTILTSIIIFLFATHSFAANLLKNGDFEKSKGKNITNFNYQVPAKQKYYELDTKIKHGGKQSLKIGGLIKTWIGFQQLSFKVKDFTKPLKISGWAKYENIISQDKDGTICGQPFIGLWSFTAKSRNSLSLGIKCFNEGSKDWFYFEKIFTPEEYKRASSHLKGDKAPATFVFRINVSSQPGTVWFDDLQLSWVDVKEVELKAQFPVSDIQENTISLNITVAKNIKSGSVDISLDNNKKLGSFTVKAGLNKIKLNLGSIADGKHSISIKAGKNFDPKTPVVKLNFSKQPDAFAE